MNTLVRLSAAVILVGAFGFVGACALRGKDDAHRLETAGRTNDNQLSAIPLVGARGGRVHGECGVETPKPDLAELRHRAVYSPDPEERYDAVISLAMIPGNSVVPYLMAAATDADGDVSAAAVQALGERRAKARLIAPLLVKLLETEKKYTVAISTDLSFERPVRYAVARAIGELGKDAEFAAPALRRCAGILPPNSPKVAKPETDHTEKDALRCLVPRDLVRIQCALAYGRVSGETEQVLDLLIAHLESERSLVRAEAAQAIGETRGVKEPGIQALIERLRTDRDPSVRTMSAWALGHIAGNGGAIVATLESALKDEDPIVRGSAAISITRHFESSEDVLKKLLAAQEGFAEDPFLASYLGRAIVKSVGHDKALDFLQGAFRDAKSDRQRLGIALIVSRIGGQRRMELLEKFADQSDGKLKSNLRNLADFPRVPITNER